MSTSPFQKIVLVPELENPVRLDVFIASLGQFTRNQWERRQGAVTSGGKPLKPSFKLKGGETLELTWLEPEASTLTPQEIPLEILWEDSQLIVLNKSRGLVVHPAAGHQDGTLVNGLLHHIKDLQEDFDEESARPGIVHRLDKDTTGVLVCAKTPEALEFLARQFREKTARKVYWALVKGQPSASGSWKTGLIRDPRNRQRFTTAPEEQGKWAWTDWAVREVHGRFSWLELYPHTGRTHQLRVHCSKAGFPILGDPIYTRPEAEFPHAPLMLHAYSLTLTMPEGGQRTFTAPIPQDFREVGSKAGFFWPTPEPY